MSKHASEMTLEEMKPVLIANGLFGAQRLLRELKAHQSEQDAEIARLKEQLDGVLAAVDAEPDYRGIHDATHIKRNIKARILAAKESGDA